MFVVVPVKDVVIVSPDALSLDHHTAVYKDVDVRYTGRVMYQCGVVIGVFDIPKISAAELKQGLHGSAEISVLMRLIVFQPVVGEAMLSTVVGSSPHGLRVALPFTEVSIQIPPSALQPSSVWDATSSRWVWQYADDEGGDDPPDITHLPYAHGANIKIKITGVHFDTPPEAVPPGERSQHLAAKDGQPAPPKPPVR